jgi:hypothetical protein
MSAAPDMIIKAAFDRDIDALILAAIHAGITHFADLLRQLPSVYPTEVFRSLDRLTDRGFVRVGIATGIRREAGQRVATLPEGRSLLPLPHPLDYEWRLTPDASRNLPDLAANLTLHSGSVSIGVESGLFRIFGAAGLVLGRRINERG